jgi:hemerythrin-like domain-containing protein
VDFDVDVIQLLLGHHLALSDLFARHQEALVERRWTEAARLLDEYGQSLLRHIDFEERNLLPRCDAVGSARWSSAVYRAEHRRIEQLLCKATDRLRHARESEITPAVLISLLDEERTLKHLIEHHHEREEKALFVELRGEAALSREAVGAARMADERRLVC